MSPMETIVAATSSAAAALGLGDRTGAVEAGRWADLLVVDGDPLADIGILQDRDKLAVIMKDGQTFKDVLSARVPARAGG